MSRVAHQTGAYPGFRSMKRLRIYITTYVTMFFLLNIVSYVLKPISNDIE